MRASFLRLAESVSGKPLTLNEVSAALIPPKPSSIPPNPARTVISADLRYMGDGYYVKAVASSSFTFSLPS
ncbi:hypothetical protein C8R46DRAFT_1228653 [Mycena filopes]|nr:hypothetical protein C8R46DRAFT_1228653 [Mycena filopes]